MTSNVLVVGGGIAGFGFARALSLQGLPCVVVDRAPVPPESGLGLNLPANAVRALAALGVADEVVDVGARVRRREYRTRTGRLLFAVDEETFWGGVGPSVCVRRSALLDILRANAALVTERWNCPVVSASTAEPDVEVRLENGAVEHYDYLVGADGVHSAVRPVVGGEIAVSPSAMTAASWRFMVPNPGVTCWTVWSGSESTLLLIPVDEPNAYGYASATRGGAGAAGQAWLETAFDDFPSLVRDAVAAALANPTQLFGSPVVEVHAERWSQPKITLIGDAAHAMGPVWAQGAALALEDGLVLAELLAQRADWSAVGAEFERRRRPRVAHVQAATDRMSRLAALPVWLRDLAGPVLGPHTYRAAYGPLRSPP